MLISTARLRALNMFVGLSLHTTQTLVDFLVKSIITIDLLMYKFRTSNSVHCTHNSLIHFASVRDCTFVSEQLPLFNLVLPPRPYRSSSTMGSSETLRSDVWKRPAS